MASSINALTTGSGGVITTADNSGDLNIQSGGSTKIAVTSAGVAVTGLSKGSLPTGSVLQVVNATSSTQVSTTSTSFVTAGLSATITPTSATSKVFVSFTAPLLQATATQATAATIFRGTVAGTNLGHANYGFGTVSNNSSQILSNVCGQILDSPATTSAQVYTIGIKVTGGTGYISISGEMSTITLMEIAA
jgi:hypothetical protein